MVSPFDGMSRVLSGVFGASITVAPKDGAERVEEATFREGPVVVLGRDGQEVTTVLPTLKIRRTLGADLVPGGTVKPGNSKVYICVSKLPNGSPAEDAHMMIELERIDAPS
ncbi:MAG: hypothetical protein ABJO67_03425 [Pseudoruegeria sp.]